MNSLAARTPAPIQVSFEFFPPKTEAMEKQLWNAVETLAPAGPAFMSVTYGAGGSTRERTHAVVSRIQNEIGIPAARIFSVVARTPAASNSSNGPSSQLKPVFIAVSIATISSAISGTLFAAYVNNSVSRGQ